jgi:hypothetical protein
MGSHLRRLRGDAGLRRRLGDGARAVAAGHSLDRQVAAYRELLASMASEPVSIDL